MFVVKNNDNGKFVARPGSFHSYTYDLKEARKFVFEDDARRECCGNEKPMNLERLLDEYRR